MIDDDERRSSVAVGGGGLTEAIDGTEMRFTLLDSGISRVEVRGGCREKLFQQRTGFP
jgi:hypothetical protein